MASAPSQGEAVSEDPEQAGQEQTAVMTQVGADLGPQLSTGPLCPIGLARHHQQGQTPGQHKQVEQRPHWSQARLLGGDPDQTLCGQGCGCAGGAVASDAAGVEGDGPAVGGDFAQQDHGACQCAASRRS
jgi:hypothetical protein